MPSELPIANLYELKMDKLQEIDGLPDFLKEPLRRIHATSVVAQYLCECAAENPSKRANQALIHLADVLETQQLDVMGIEASYSRMNP
jgi:hypothetical protein